MNSNNGKIELEIDVTKIDKTKIQDASYISKSDGSTVKKTKYKMELVPLKEPKVIKETETYVFKKTHFIVEKQTKEERSSKSDSVFIGDGFQYFDKQPSESVDVGVSENINPEDIPF